MTMTHPCLFCELRREVATLRAELDLACGDEPLSDVLAELRGRLICLENGVQISTPPSAAGEGIYKVWFDTGGGGFIYGVNPGSHEYVEIESGLSWDQSEVMASRLNEVHRPTPPPVAPAEERCGYVYGPNAYVPGPCDWPVEDHEVVTGHPFTPPATAKEK